MEFEAEDPWKTSVTLLNTQNTAEILLGATVEGAGQEDMNARVPVANNDLNRDDVGVNLLNQPKFNIDRSLRNGAESGVHSSQDSRQGTDSTQSNGYNTILSPLEHGAAANLFIDFNCSNYGKGREENSDKHGSNDNSTIDLSMISSPQRSKNRSQTITNYQNMFTESQKVAYVCMCTLSISQYQTDRLTHDAKKFTKDNITQRNAMNSFKGWADAFKDKLYIYLDISVTERGMIESMAMHGVPAQDLADAIMNNVNFNTEVVNQQDIADVRVTILSHLFIICTSGGIYDARSRTLLKTVANYLGISGVKLTEIETSIANQLLVFSAIETDEMGQNVNVENDLVKGRNKMDGKHRWLLAGLATLAGGTVIGLTAGLAAPFIGAGIVSGLATLGISGAGVASVGTFITGAGGLAFITTGGGGMSGVKMMKRTRAIEEFEFIGIREALDSIETHRTQRKLKRKEKEPKLEKSVPTDEEIASLPKFVESTSVIWDSAENIEDSSSNQSPKKANQSSIFITIRTDKSENNSTHSLGKDPDLAENLEHVILSGPDQKSAATASSRLTNVLITIAGFVTHDRDDHTYPFSVLSSELNGDQYTLIWETKVLKELGTTLGILLGEIASFIFQQGLQLTVLPVLMAALTAPMWIIKLTYLLGIYSLYSDNPWGNALTKAEKTGRLLADLLISNVQSGRPVTLVGFSVGARVIYSCLLELASRQAFGIVEAVYLIGTPALCSATEWIKILSVVSGRVVNAYYSSDTLLSLLYRATSAALFNKVAGLSPAEISGVEDIDLEGIVEGHLDYYTKMPKLLAHLGFQTTRDHFIDQTLEEELYRESQKPKKPSVIVPESKNEKLLHAIMQKQKPRKEWDDAQEEIKQLSELNQMMDDYWVPREIVSTMPAMHIRSLNNSDDIGNVDIQNEMVLSDFEPKEITSTLPPLHIELKK